MTSSRAGRFAGQHAIITGGSSGIGKAVALLLSQEGASITLIARGQERLDAACSDVEAARGGSAGKVLGIAADVAIQAQVDAAVAQSIQQLGPPRILVASAGMAHPDYFTALPMDVFRTTMEVNYFGTLYAIRAVLPAMREQKSGHIVVLSSGAGLIGIFGYTAYSPTKFAVRGLAEALRGEIKPDGITMSVVYPPDTDTPQLHEENKTKPKETKAIAGNAKTWPADGVAKAIVRGIEKKEFVVAPGFEMGMLARAHSLLSPALQWYFDKVAAGARK